jgi:signal transduction histidine kinase
VVSAICRTPPRHGRIAPPPADPDEELTRLTGELAHEIKNPLSTIKVNLKLAEEALQDVDLSDPGRVLWDQSRQRLAGALRKIAIIQKETDRLEQILDGFLKYVRRPDLQLETVDLNELVGDMIDFYSPQAYSHSLTVRQSLAKMPLTCRVDPGAVKQVLLNLFINAQQAMDTGGDLMIRTARRGGCAVVQVNDTGRGIPPERLATLFRPYQSSRSSGMGLGLATAKKIIEAHRGDIAVHSEVGKGTSFTISLPLAEEDALPAEEAD